MRERVLIQIAGFSGFKIQHDGAFAPIEAWRRIRHPNVVSVREAFTTRLFGDHCTSNFHLLPPLNSFLCSSHALICPNRIQTHLSSSSTRSFFFSRHLRLRLPPHLPNPLHRTLHSQTSRDRKERSAATSGDARPGEGHLELRDSVV